MAVCSIQIWYWEVCLEHLLGHHLGHFWYIIWSHVCGATCISDAGFCGRLCQYLMWHIVFSFYNSQNYSAFYYEEVTAFELSTSKVKTAVSSALGMSDSVIVWGFHLNCGIIWIVGDFHPYLIFVIFSPRALFLAKFFSTQKCVNRKIDLRQNSVNCQRKNVFHQNSVKCNRIL